MSRRRPRGSYGGSKRGGEGREEGRSVGFEDDFEAESPGRENARSPGADEYGSVDDAYGSKKHNNYSKKL